MIGGPGGRMAAIAAAAKLAGVDQGVVRASGIIVPPELEAEPDQSAPPDQLKAGMRPTAYDPDKRRRIVWTEQEQRKIDQVIQLLRSQGLGMVVLCDRRFDGKDPCRQPLRTELEDTEDKGYGCTCTRVHFLKK
jgi:hypothetical protein